MLRWLLGSREPQGAAEKSAVYNINEEQPQNPYTELQALEGHHDIVRYLIKVDDYRFASAGDDGIVFLWNVQTGERLAELHGHTQQITAIAVLSRSNLSQQKSHRILTASSDRTVYIWDVDTGKQLHTLSDFYSTVKCLIVLEHLSLWLSGGNDLRVWNFEWELQCKTDTFDDSGISAIIEIPKNCIVAAVDRELIIFKLTLPTEEYPNYNIIELKRLYDHQDNIRALSNVNDNTFVSGSHAGEMMVWDSLTGTLKADECGFWVVSPPADSHSGIKMLRQQNEVSVQNIISDGKYIFIAVGRGIYVYSLETKSVIACQRTAHDLNVLFISEVSSRQLMSCSEDGNVRIWELREYQPSPEASSGFFSMWGFGRPNKQASHVVKKKPESTVCHKLDLIGDLIGHSGAVQMFLYFEEHMLVTCSADHLVIIWKNGELESRLRSSALFHKLEQENGLQLCL
ncbi:WD repeat-containing protein 41 isoform X2 [Protopterus annectens]|nr:WD repeat-containing protein 41 isoform X2 [Protopterus annectens]XP_043919634.1 WD repeat-containing protein 41 isoform X2 [Protopterus annectens]